MFIGFSEVANYYSNLTKGLDSLGINYYFFTFESNIRNYSVNDSKLIDQKLLHLISRIYNQSILTKVIIFPIFFFFRIYLFIKYFLKCSHFIFNYNASFLYFVDCIIMRFFGKHVCFVYHGSDGRPTFLSGNHIYNKNNLLRVYIANMQLYLKNRIVNKIGSSVINLPSSSQFFSRYIYNFGDIGLPIDLENANINNEFIYFSSDSSKLKILHAPSERKSKGSDFFRKVIEKLKLTKLADTFEYVEVHGVENSVVLSNLSKADILLDERFSDTRLAGLATEAAYYGVPTIVAGYFSEYANFSDFHPPCIYCDPDKIEEQLIYLIKNNLYRKNLGKRAKSFVQNNWKPKDVASRYIKILQNDNIKPRGFFADKVVYPFGWGVHKIDLINFLKIYLDKFGENALLLNHNPRLKAEIIKLSIKNTNCIK